MKTEPEKNDLRAITRSSDRCITTVSLRRSHRNDAREPWLVCGEAQLMREQRAEPTRWTLSAYLREAVDPEHDSAYAFSMLLIGVEFGDVSYNFTTVYAYVDPDSGADEDGRFARFRVPLVGYNPLEHPQTTRCEECARVKGREAHLIVPEGFYQPKFEPELFEIVRGRCVTIRFGPVLKDTEE